MFNHRTIVLFLICFTCFVLQKSYSLENDEPFYLNSIPDKSLIVDSDRRYDEQYPINDQDMDLERPSYANHRRSESAEKYFGWAEKTQRPLEFLRGKRFWLFAKKDESGGVSVEVPPPIQVQSGSLTKGLWRSGIVGRRRRRR